jgi:putative membrane protein
MNWLLKWVASAVALVVAVHIGHALGLGLAFRTSGATGLAITALLAAAVFGIVNAVIRPLVELIAMPITCLTLGAFSFVINAAMFWMTSLFVPGFVVHGFWAAAFGSVLVSIVSGLVDWLLNTVAEKG